MQEKHLRKKVAHTILLFISIGLFKIACDAGYVVIVSNDVITYSRDFHLIKYLNGILWCVVLFFGIRHEKREVSVFMLCLVYLMQIIPITTIYSYGNGSACYYNILCASFFLCEIMSQCVIKRVQLQRKKIISDSMISAFVILWVIILIYIIKKNGTPSLIALDIYRVYELRRADSFIIGKYIGYLFRWFIAAAIPFLIAKKINEKSYICACLICGSTFLIYLYSGHKSYLFEIPIILICTLWAKRKTFYKEIVTVGCISFFLLVIMACYSPILKPFFERIFSLFGRRLLMVSANNKFMYYDFFSQNPKMGLGGIYPRWLIDIPNYYEDIDYTHLLSEIYYGKPEMGSNTGFLAEGYMRFGHIGTVGIMIVFALLLCMMNGMQKRGGYALTIGVFVYPVLMLSDTHLIDTLLFGPWTLLLCILFLYKPDKKQI